MKAHSRFQEGFALHQQGDINAARVLYERALKWHPSHFDALHMLATIAYQAGQLDKAEALFLKALKIDPDAVYALNNFGNLLQDLKNTRQRLRTTIGRFRSIQTTSMPITTVAICCNRWGAGQKPWRVTSGRSLYRRIMRLSHYNRGNALGMMGRFEEAVASYDLALGLVPDYAQAHMNRGNALNELGRHADAVDSFDRAIEYAPDIPYLLGTRLHVNMQMCDWRHYRERLDAVLDAVKSNQPASLPFPLLALTSDPALQLRAAQTWITATYPAAKQAHRFSKRANKTRLRIGYFSADFRQHPVAQLIAGLFEAHDRSRFEIYAFSSGPDTRDEMRLRLESGFEHFIDVREESDAQLIARARELELDIAVDLSGLTTGCRPAVFAARVAPVQINYLGYPGTMGATYMDYILADETLISPESERFYTEKVILFAS